jgi:type VI secretion system protein ImpH
METKTWRQIPDLKRELLEHPREFSFVEAIRLLRFIASAPESGVQPDAPERLISIRPKLSLDFPPTDIESIEEVDVQRGMFTITTTFPALYGTGSPLPTFYTEELFDDASEDITITREFLDLFHNHLYHLFYRIATRYHLAGKVVEEKDQDVLKRLFALSGFATIGMRRSLPASFSLLSHIEPFAHYPRSAEGLRGVVAEIAGIREIQVEQCIPATATIPEDQQCRLGVGANQLGVDCCTGSRIRHCTGTIRITSGPLSAATYQRLLPGKTCSEQLASLIDIYLDQPLSWEFDLLVIPDAQIKSQLGAASWNRLGVDSWCGDILRRKKRYHQIRFYPCQLKAKPKAPQLQTIVP